MNGYGQLNYNDSLINALAQQRALEQQQNAIQQGMAGNNGWTGGAGILGQALLGLAAGKKAKQQQSLDAEIQKQIAQMQAGAEQQARDLEAKKSQGMYETALGILGNEQQARAVQQGLAKISDFQKKDAESTPAIIEAKYLFPNDPEKQNQYVSNARNKSGVTVNNNQGDKTSEYDKKFSEVRATKDYEMYNSLRNDAMLARNTQNTLDQIKPLLEGMKTGWTPDLMATAGKIFNTQGAIDKQTVDSLVGSLVMEELNKMKGSAQIEERKYIQQLQASYDKSPEANMRIIEYLSNKNKDKMDNFNEADTYLSQNKTLDGYTPSFIYSSPYLNQKQEQQPKQQPNQELLNMSDDDLMRALQNAN